MIHFIHEGVPKWTICWPNLWFFNQSYYQYHASWSRSQTPIGWNFLWIQQIANQNKKSSKKSRDNLENQLAVWQYIPELKSLSFLSVGVPKDPSLRWSLTHNLQWSHSKNRVWDHNPEPRQRTVWPDIWEFSHSFAICTIH